MGNKLAKILVIYFLVAGLAALVALGYLLSIPGNSSHQTILGISARWFVVSFVALALLIAAGIFFMLAYFSWRKSSKTFYRIESILTKKSCLWELSFIAVTIFLLGAWSTVSHSMLPIQLVVFIRLQPLLVWVMFVTAISTLLCLALLIPDRIHYRSIESITLNNAINLKAYIYSIVNKIVSHFRLLSIKKKSILEYFSSPYRILLISIFTILFLPHVFVVVRDINFVLAYEVDPGSIIQSILSLYQHNYNMNAAYHSSYYGWTYYVINFILLAPIYIAQKLKIIADDYYFFFIGLRFIFFMIGLSSILAFFEIVKRTLKNKFLSFTATLLFIASPTIFSNFYILHPESTGLLFSFFGVLCLLNFNDGKAKDYHWYTFGLLSLVLSALSKQVFFITALPVLFLFYYLYCHHHNISIIKFAISRQFAKVLLYTIFLSLLVFFIINPFAFFQPKVFIANQMTLFSTQTHGSESNMEAITNWLGIIKSIPIIYISMILAPITLIGAIIFGHDQNVGKIFYIVNIFSSILYVIIISISARYLIQVVYFSPIYPYFILNLLSIPLYIVRKWNITIIKLLIMIPVAYFMFFILIADFSNTIPVGYNRLMYQDTQIYKVYNYIKENIPDGSKIAYDQTVAFPSNKGLIGCRYWQGCGTDYIEKFKPDYVIFSETQKFNGETSAETARLIKYINDHHFILIDTISYGGGNPVSVWKRPNP